MATTMIKDEKDINKTTDQYKEIRTIFAEFCAKNRDCPVIVHGSNEIKALYKIIEKEIIKSKQFEHFELFREIFKFASTLIVVSPDDNEFSEKITSFVNELKIEKIYTATIIFRQLCDIPISTKLGDLEIIEPNLSTNGFKDNLELWGISISDEDAKSATWGRLSFKSYRTIGIEDILFEKLELPLGILSLIMGVDLDPTKIICIIQSLDVNICSAPVPKEPLRTHRYIPEDCGDALKLISDISTESNPSNLKQKILQAIQIFALSRLAHKFEIRFIMVVTSCESLLLSPIDRDYLSLKLSEKTAYLLKTEGEERFELFNRMKIYYGKRSDFIHGKRNKIKMEDTQYIDHIFKSLVFKLLELSAKYKQMDKNDDGSGVENYLDELKFNLSPKK